MAVPLITDKFGKASISSNYATATTVKTLRNPGESVLACYDLSKFAPDTPVFFITYKKTTDPTTGEVSVTSVTSWKALVNPDVNTLTNLQLAPGYTDIGNDVGDFVECIPTSYWGNSLIDGLMSSLNPDGTLKTSAVQSALNIGTVPADYTPLAINPNSVVNNGNRSYTLVYPGIDYTDRLSPGRRLRTVRNVVAPNQSTSLNGTNQYFSKTSPAGMTFTDDFTVSAWVKLTSYPSGSADIVSRVDATGIANGFALYVSSSGQVYLIGRTGSSANYKFLTTYQSLPLNKWVHITAQLDCSSFTTATNKAYFDGVEVPVALTSGGTITAITQAGDLVIGAKTGGGEYFPGKIAQAAIFSSLLSAATIRSYMSQGLTGTEASLVSAYSLSNSLNDLVVANANNLTANNAATTTNADSPFGGQADGSISTTVDYGIVQKVSYAAPDTTVIVQVPEGCTIPTIGTVTTSYSGMSTPYGFPRQRAKWQHITYWRVSVNMSAASNVWSSGVTSGMTLVNAPVGEWNTTYSLETYGDNGASTTAVRFATLSTSPTAETDAYWSTNFEVNQATGTTYLAVTMSKTGQLSVPTATPYYALMKSTGAIGNQQLNVSNTSSYVILENAFI